MPFTQLFCLFISLQLFLICNTIWHSGVLTLHLPSISKCLPKVKNWIRCCRWITHSDCVANIAYDFKKRQFSLKHHYMKNKIDTSRWRIIKHEPISSKGSNQKNIILASSIGLLIFSIFAHVSHILSESYSDIAFFIGAFSLPCGYILFRYLYDQQTSFSKNITNRLNRIKVPLLFFSIVYYIYVIWLFSMSK